MPGEEMLLKSLTGGGGLSPTMALGATYKIFDSIRKNRQANEIGRNTVRPVYQRGSEIDDVYNLSASELGNNQQQDFVAQQLEQSQSAGIDAILKSGGKADFGVINNAYGSQFQAALSNVSRARDQKIANYNNAAYSLAKAKDAEFQYNKDAPYKDAKQAEAQLRQQGEQAKNEAISIAAGMEANSKIGNLAPGQYGSDQVTQGAGQVGASVGGYGNTQRIQYDPTALDAGTVFTGR